MMSTHVTTVVGSTWGADQHAGRHSDMPSYQYVCIECKAQQELCQLQDQDPERCPRCGAARSLNRKLGRTHSAPEGTGWCQTSCAAK